MNRIAIFIFSLFLMLGNVATVQAQPAQKRVVVIISPDHADWQYKLKEEASFQVQVFKDNVLVKNVSVDYELGPEYFPTEKKQDVVLKNGEMNVKSSMKQPGFLRCKVIAKVDGSLYEGMTTVGYDVEKIEPTASEPKDFDEFWTNAIQQARKPSLDARMILLPEKCTVTRNVYEVSFQNGASRMYGILTVPSKPGKYPAILAVPGAGVRPYGGQNYGDDIISLEMGIHGVSVTLPSDVYVNLGRGALGNYPQFSMNNRDTHYYKRVFTGCVRAVDFIYSLPEFDGNTVGITGGSQGGALSIITTGLDPRIKFLAAYFPAMCDHTGYLSKRAGGWPHYFRNVEPKANELETLAYFDVVNFARRVKVKGWYSWGFNDVVCPPTSMHAAYNVITAEKELYLERTTGHWTYPEQTAVGGGWLLKQCRE